MIYLEADLNSIKDCLKEGFINPLPNSVLENFLLGESKLIRAKIALLYLKSQNKKIDKRIYNILAAGEIIHNASLLHDDVLDEAEIRRGHTTIAKKFSDKISILAGDYLIAYSIEKLLELQNFQILNIFKQCTQLMSQSEIRQFLLRGTIPSESEYLDICRGKTAILFSSILESCAMITNLDEICAKQFGELFGLCFQIKNDLDSVSANQDKKNRIYTATEVLGIEKTNYLLDNYKEEMRKILLVFPDNIYKQGLEDLIKDI